MQKLFFFIVCIAMLVTGFSFIISHSEPAKEVKENYLKKTADFVIQTQLFKEAVISGDQKKIKAQFIQTRLAYKKIEIFAEYFFPFYAVKLNGPPIPFYEDTEPEKGGQAPNGMQLIESYIYPSLNKEETSNLIFQADELVRYAIEMPTVYESMAFDNANIFDAIVEQFYRITAMGIAGFDSQLAVNSLQESKVSLQELHFILSFYEEGIEDMMPGAYARNMKLLDSAILYLNKNNNFDRFNRMEFIQQYLNPLTIFVTDYKKSRDYKANIAGLYYSTIKKDNSLFAKNAFNPYRFLDDYTSTPLKIALGKKLFFEKRLSSNNERSCASCHQPGLTFTDGLKTSVAMDGHTSLPRNAPTIWNASLQRSLFADSRSRTLEEQVMQVLNNANEMSGSAIESAKKIIALEEYTDLYKNAYPGAKEDKAAENISNAIASFERTLISQNSKFDRHMRGEAVMTQNEINGFNLFMSKAKCGTCHFVPLFSGAKPPRYYYIESEVIGVPLKNTKKNSQLDTDSGRYLITGIPMHQFAFKTPGLRNVALTAPYMHNGVFNTLEEVVDFYNKGGGKGLKIDPSNQTLPFDKLNLTKKEKADIVLFLKCLTDTSTSY